MPDFADLIWVEDAVKQYKRSRAWFNDQITARRLSVAKIPGDKRLYLVRAELERLITPQIIQRAEDSAAG